jgi:hypothetical protein
MGIGVMFVKSRRARLYCKYTVLGQKCSHSSLPPPPPQVAKSARLPVWATQRSSSPSPLLIVAQLPSLTPHVLPSARLIESPSLDPFLAPGERGRNRLLRRCCSGGAPHTKVFHLPHARLLCYGRPCDALHRLSLKPKSCCSATPIQLSTRDVVVLEVNTTPSVSLLGSSRWLLTFSER